MPPAIHMLKPPIGITHGRNLALALALSPESEWLCARILSAQGLPIKLIANFYCK